MARLVANTSALVSLGIVADSDPNPLSLCLESYDVLVPDEVLKELHEIASYDDNHGRAATNVLNQIDELTVQSVNLDVEFPLDDGENAAVTLANEIDATLLLCEEFNRLGLVQPHWPIHDS